MDIQSTQVIIKMKQSMARENKRRPESYPQGRQKINNQCTDQVMSDLEDLEKFLKSAQQRKCNEEISDTFSDWFCNTWATATYPYLWVQTHAIPPYAFGKCLAEDYWPPIEPKSAAEVKALEKEASAVSSLSSCSATSRTSSLDVVGDFKMAKDTQAKAFCRSQMAQRRVDSAFRTLSEKFETTEDSLDLPMFIISQIHYDNVLWLIRKISKKNQCKKGVKKKCAGQFQRIFQNKNHLVDCNGLDALTGGSGNESRGELDLLVLHSLKGILLVQVKAISIYKPTDTSVEIPTEGDKQTKEVIEKKINEAKKQLDKDEKVLEHVMGKSSTWNRHRQKPVTKVIALPNMTKEEVEKYYGIKEEAYRFLCWDDLPIEHTGTAESDTASFKKWWDEMLPSFSDSSTIKIICQEIIGKYIGPLSGVLEVKEGNMIERVRRFRDCIRQASFYLEESILTEKQIAISQHAKDQRRVYLSGPPGSGKTVMLILKAYTFLRADSDHTVVVVNMYRGAEGRSLGHTTWSTLSSYHGADGRVLLLDVDVENKDFVQRANLILKDKSLKKVLFLVDEIYVESFWKEILDAFTIKVEGQVGEKGDVVEERADSEVVKAKHHLTKNGVEETSQQEHEIQEAPKGPGAFAESEVWCAGLFSSRPSGFQEHKLDIVLRCPPAVQNLLYTVDWNENRKEKYTRWAKCPEVVTEGPKPLCVRHKGHEEPLASCSECAARLAQILTEENLVRKLTAASKHVSAPTPGTAYSQTESEQTDPKVVLLFNMPRDHYKQFGGYIEASVEDYKSYMQTVLHSHFIKVLGERGINVVVREELGCKGLSGCDVTATWLYNFQGLESDVVIFFPGDLACPPGGAEHEARDIPTPGLSRTSPAEDVSSGKDIRHESRPLVKSYSPPVHLISAQGAVSAAVPPSLASLGPHSSQRSSRSKSKSPYRETTEHKQRQRSNSRATRDPSLVERRKHATQESRPEKLALAYLHWKDEDIKRFSTWDRTNILVAGSRTRGLLVLIVP